MIYPKRKTVKAQLGADLEGILGGATGGLSMSGTSIGSSISNVTGSLWKDKDHGEGVFAPTVGESTVTTGIKGMGLGYDVGKNFGPIGAAVGAGIGLVGGATVGAIKGNSIKEQAIAEANRRMKGRSNDQAEESRMYYGGMSRYTDGMYAKGGEAPATTDQGGAVILGGKSHYEGGNDIVDLKSGEKIAETESRELVLDVDQTNLVEAAVTKKDALKAGNIMKTIVQKQTTDRSGAYGLKGERKPQTNSKMVQKEGNEDSAHLKGKERIYSREATAKIVGMAMNANNIGAIRMLGEFVINETTRQDLRPTEYNEE
jgi:hypothetical protein